MKGNKILLFLCIMVLSLGMAGCSSSKSEKSKQEQKVAVVKSDWTVSKIIPISHKNNIGALYNDKFGITVGYSGEVHYTTDGGVTWPRGANVSACRFGLDIVNEKIAWSCGNAGNVRKTIDGGQTWQEVTDYGDYEPNMCRNLSFLSENVGWISASKLLGSTKDGGKTWVEVKLPEGMGKILGMFLQSENTGYLIDSNSKLYTTKDAGSTWNSKDLKITDLYIGGSTTNTSFLRFTDEKNATFFYYSKDMKLKGITTKDGGNTWDEILLPVLYGDGLYLSPDGKVLSLNSDVGSKITILKHQ